MLADRGIDGDGEGDVHGGVGDCAEDERRPRDVPGDVVLRGEGVEVVFLRVVEVWLEEHPRVVLFLGDGRGAEVESVVFGAGLEHDALWGDGGEREGGEEVGEQEGCDGKSQRPGRVERKTDCSLCTFLRHCSIELRQA